MNYGNETIELKKDKFLRIRASYTMVKDQPSRSFQFDYQIATSKPVVQMTLESFITLFSDNVLAKFAPVQDKRFKWIRCTVQPDLTAPNVKPVVFPPKVGDVEEPTPDKEDFIVNLILSNTSQSRNVVIPGVSRDVDANYSTYAKSLTALENVFCQGFGDTDVTFSYMRLGPDNSASSVRGASAVGFRPKK